MYGKTLLCEVYNYELSPWEIVHKYRTQRMLFMSPWWMLRKYLRLTWLILVGREIWEDD